MNRFREVMDYLILEADTVREDIIRVKTMLEACPSCRVKRANVVTGLAKLGETMADVMIDLKTMGDEAVVCDSLEGGEACEPKQMA